MIFPTLILLLSCDKQDMFISCNNCTEKEPLTVMLNVKIDPSAITNCQVAIRLYDGNLEDSILLSNYTSENSATAISVSVNKKYTITATYYRYGISYTAIDCVTPGVRFESELCEKPCYFVYNNKVDLRIKYTQ
jgi:hypothetical protein